MGWEEGASRGSCRWVWERKTEEKNHSPVWLWDLGRIPTPGWTHYSQTLKRVGSKHRIMQVGLDQVAQYHVQVDFGPPEKETPWCGIDNPWKRVSGNKLLLERFQLDTRRTFPPHENC